MTLQEASSVPCRRHDVSPQRTSPTSYSAPPLFSQEDQPRQITEIPMTDSVLGAYHYSDPPTVVPPTSPGPLLAPTSNNDPNKNAGTASQLPSNASDSSNPMDTLTPSFPPAEYSTSSEDAMSLVDFCSDTSSSDSSFQPTSPPARLRGKRQLGNRHAFGSKGAKMISEKKTIKKKDSGKTEREARMEGREGRKERKWRLDREDWRLIAGAKREGKGEGAEEGGKGKRRRR